MIPRLTVCEEELPEPPESQALSSNKSNPANTRARREGPPENAAWEVRRRPGEVPLHSGMIRRFKHPPYGDFHQVEKRWSQGMGSIFGKIPPWGSKMLFR